MIAQKISMSASISTLTWSKAELALFSASRTTNQPPDENSRVRLKRTLSLNLTENQTNNPTHHQNMNNPSPFPDVNPT